MPVSFMASALLGISLLTNLTVQGTKKLFDKTDTAYSSNLIAAVVSIILAGAGSMAYMVMTDLVLTPKIGVKIIALMYLSFLVSTVGYDKVIQTLNQMKGE